MKKRQYKYKVTYTRIACGNTIYTHFTVYAPSLKEAKTDVARWEQYTNNPGEPGIVIKVTSVKRI